MHDDDEDAWNEKTYDPYVEELFRDEVAKEVLAILIHQQAKIDLSNCDLPRMLSFTILSWKVADSMTYLRRERFE